MDLTQLELCKKSPLLGTDGLTSTSANFLANKAKEMYDSMEREVKSVTFLHKDYKVIDKETVRVDANADEKIFELIKGNLNKIGKLKAFIAWLREGIKLKDETMQFINGYSLTDYIKNVANIQPIQQPYPESIDENAIRKELGYEKLQRSLELEAMAASIGQYIHKNGSISKARQEFNDMLNKTVVTGQGTETTFITYRAAVDSEVLEKNYMELQELQRKYQAELNGIRHEIELKILDAKREISLKYQEAYREYSKQLNEYKQAFTDWVREQSKAISELKIVIPESLKEIYSIVKGA